MTKYIGTISITVEADHEADLQQLATDIVETANHSATTRTSFTTSVVIIEDYSE